MPKTKCKVVELLSELKELGQRYERVTVGQVSLCLGQRSYGPFLLVPALFGVSPVGGIPGVPTFLAALLGLFAIQILIGRRHLWLPAVLTKQSIPGGTLSAAAEKMAGIGKVMDRVFEGRVAVFTRDPFPRIAASIILLLCCVVPPLELLPFAVAAPMAVIGSFGLALLVRDGLLMLVALVGSGTVGWFIVSVLLFGW